ncbi:MAG: PAS domain-containing protein [Pseudomonadota bacterium]
MVAYASDAAGNGELILREDDPSDPALAGLAAPPWRILIVDDDVDVHVVTKFALSNTQFQGRRLNFLHAYSGKEAMAILRSTPDIAIVLLDVIMETPEAGLLVARQVREELGNALVRIVLRTGQPGQSLEHSIILDYDINDFWCKADLTTRKLFTTVISSLRAYTALSAAASDRAALAEALEHARKLQVLVDQHAMVLTLDAEARIVDANEVLCRTAGIPRAALLGRDLHVLHPAPFPAALAGEIRAALAAGASWSGDIASTDSLGQPILLRCAVLGFRDDAGQMDQAVALATVVPSPASAITPAH